MRLTAFLAMVGFTGMLFAQSSPNLTVASAVYFLKDATGKRWCGYASESRMEAHAEVLNAFVMGSARYIKGHVSAVHVTETDETGDWAVNDNYVFDDNERLRGLKRTINIIPEDLTEDQVFVIGNATARMQRVTRRELNTGKPTNKSVDWFEAPPVVTRPAEFPFWTLIERKRQVVWSQGKACIPESAR